MSNLEQERKQKENLGAFSGYGRSRLKNKRVLRMDLGPSQCSTQLRLEAKRKLLRIPGRHVESWKRFRTKVSSLDNLDACWTEI